jgi:hypothetical protein
LSELDAAAESAASSLWPSVSEHDHARSHRLRTPVMAWRQGSVPEVVDHSVTGVSALPS